MNQIPVINGLQRTINARIWRLVPAIGCMIYILLYILAAALYPGGSTYDSHAPGFSWCHNFWCHLLRKEALNGEINAGQPAAIMAVVVLVLSLSLFFHQLAGWMNISKALKHAIKFCGLGACASSLLLLTDRHPLSVLLVLVFSLVTMIAVVTALFQESYLFFACFGLLAFMCVLVNYCMFYAAFKTYYLPVVQKITFMICLLWVIYVSMWRYINHHVS